MTSSPGPQGPPSGPGDVKKVNIDCLGEKILADYSIGGIPISGKVGGFQLVMGDPPRVGWFRKV